MNRQIARGKIEMFNRHEMLDVVNGMRRKFLKAAKPEEPAQTA